MSLANNFEFQGVWWDAWQVQAWIKRHAPEMSPEAAILAAVTKGTLPVWGQQPGRDRGGNPASEGAGIHQIIPVEVFANPMLTIQGGQVGPALGSPSWYANLNRRNAAFYAPAGAASAPALYPLYIGVRFKAADVQRIWRATARKPRPNACTAHPSAALDAALRAYCETLPGGRVKQLDAEAYLRQEKRCSRNAARAAYNRLPPHLKLKPGKPAAINPATALQDGDMQV